MCPRIVEYHLMVPPFIFYFAFSFFLYVFFFEVQVPLMMWCLFIFFIDFFFFLRFGRGLRRTGGSVQRCPERAV